MSTVVSSAKLVKESFDRLKAQLEARGYTLCPLKGVYSGDFAYSFKIGRRKFGQIFYHHAEDADPGVETASYATFEPKADLSKGCEKWFDCFQNPHEKKEKSRREIRFKFRNYEDVKDAVTAICDYMEEQDAAGRAE